MRQSELIFTGFVKSEAQAPAPFCSACKPSGCRQPSQNSSFFFLVGRLSKLDWGSLLMSRFKYKLARVGKLLVSSQSGSVQPLENSGRCARGFEGQSTESGQMPRRCVCHQNPLCFDPRPLLSHPRHAASASPFDSELQTQTTIRSSMSPGVMSGMNGRMVKGQLLPMNRGSRTQRLNLLLGGLSFEWTSAQHDGNVSQKSTITYFLFPACEV